MITESIEIVRSPEDVFAYLADLERQPEWQGSLISARALTAGPVQVGTRVGETRQVPGGPRPSSYEITAYEPPRTLSFRGLDGPIRPVGTFTVEPVGDGARSRITVELELQGHGAGKLVVPFARREAARQIPEDYRRLKAILEGGVRRGPA